MRIAAAVEVNQPGVTKIVKKFEGAGMVKVARDSADSRKRLVSITDKGRGDFIAIQQQIAPDVQTWFADWESSDASLFLAQLQRLAGALDGQRKQ